MVWHRLTTVGFILYWWVLNLYWIAGDSLLRDGDEEGHVGAMELFKDHWINSPFAWLTEMWMGNYGEYPPLFAGTMGAWWGILTQVVGVIPPSSLWVRGALLIWPFLTGVAVARIAYRLGWHWKVAGMMMLSIPLSLGVGRHFMLEPMMAALSTCSICLALEWKHSPSWRLALPTGLVLGLSLLTKQTALLVAPLVLLTILFSANRTLPIKTLGIAGLGMGIVCLPWFLSQFETQQSYLTASAEGKIAVSIWQQFSFYPLSLPYMLGLLFPLLFLKFQKPQVPPWLWVWITTLLILISIPKQYPRLLLAWLPIIPLWIAFCWKENQAHKTNLFFALYCSFAIWFHSFHPFQSTIQGWYNQAIFNQIDDGCPQVWIRNPSQTDGGLHLIADHLQQHNTPHTISILGSPTIPCTIQTTHPWNSHLDPYFRRRNLEVHIESVSDLEDPRWQDADIQIKWKEDTIEIPMELHIVQ